MLTSSTGAGQGTGLLPRCLEPHKNKHRSAFSVHAGRIPLYMPDGGAQPPLPQGRQPLIALSDERGRPRVWGVLPPSSYHPRWCRTTQTKRGAHPQRLPPQVVPHNTNEKQLLVTTTTRCRLPQQWYYAICVQWSVKSTCNKPCNLRAIAIFVQLQSACTCNTSSNRHTKYSHVSSMYDHTRYNQAMACYSI